jgi:hypothetical protein
VILDQKTLDPRIAQIFVPLSNEMLRRGIETDWFVRRLTDQTIFRFWKYVYGEKLGVGTLTFREAPVYESPRHAFLASLPDGSFRRRFLAYFWGIDPQKPLYKIKEHVVTVERWANLPDLQYPPGMGPVVFQQCIQEQSRWV